MTALQDLGLDSDWDPEKHDNQMSKIYGVDDDGEFDEEKPVWDDDIDITDIVPEDSSSEKKKKKKKKNDEPEVEDGVDIDEMDADVVRDDEEWDGTEEMRKRKLDEYMDELYGLEFNDMVCSHYPSSPSAANNPAHRPPAYPRASGTPKFSPRHSPCHPSRFSSRPTPSSTSI